MWIQGCWCWGGGVRARRDEDGRGWAGPQSEEFEMEGGESRLAHVLLQWPLLLRHAFAVSWHVSRLCPPLCIGSIMSLLMCLCQNDRPRTIRIQNIRDERTATNNRRQNNIHEEQQYTFCAEENGATSVGRGCHQSEGILLAWAYQS